MMYKSNYKKRLRANCSRAGRRSQKVQALKREAMASQWEDPYDAIERHKHDRKGNHYDTWTKTNLCSIDIYHSVKGRSDQFDVIIWQPSKYGNGQIKTTKTNLSKPKLLKLWSEL